MNKEYISFSKPLIGSDEKKQISKVIDSGWLSTGKKTKLFEKRFKNYKKSKYMYLVEHNNEL